MKEIIEEQLYQSKTLGELAERLKYFGMETTNSRGISFIDSKGVKLKGSEIGFSMSKVMHIIQQNNLPKIETKKVDLSQRKWKKTREW